MHHPLCRVFKKDYSWKTTFTLPEMKLQADYSLFGRILLIPLNGKGQVFLDAENMTVTMHTKTRLYSKGGFTFYNVTSLHVDFKMDGLKSYFSNLFNGNKQLGEYPRPMTLLTHDLPNVSDRRGQHQQVLQRQLADAGRRPVHGHHPDHRGHSPGRAEEDIPLHSGQLLCGRHPDAGAALWKGQAEAEMRKWSGNMGMGIREKVLL